MAKFKVILERVETITKQTDLGPYNMGGRL